MKLSAGEIDAIIEGIERNLTRPDARAPSSSSLTILALATELKKCREAIAYQGLFWSEDDAGDDVLVNEVAATFADRELRLRKALMRIASFDDKLACEVLTKTGSYSAFDEPGSVEIARSALKISETHSGTDE